MTTNYIERHQHLEERLTQFGREMPGPTRAPALRSGASAGVGPGTVYAAHALDAVEQFLAESPVVSS